jgi:hypothetical protein
VVANDTQSRAPSRKAKMFGKRKKEGTKGPHSEHSQGTSNNGWTVAVAEGGNGQQIVDGGAKSVQGIGRTNNVGYF